MKTNFILFIVILAYAAAHAQSPAANAIPLDSIRLSDPFILADEKTKTYYMTGTGGRLWKSVDLRYWSGPFNVVNLKSNSWMGEKPEIWAAEIHRWGNKYFYFATFTNSSVKIDTINGSPIDRRACHILVSDNPDGPYEMASASEYVPAKMSTLDATLWIEDNVPHMVYCHEWIQNQNGTVEFITLTNDLKGSIGSAKILFHASDSPWSREKTSDQSIKPNKVTDGPFLFKTRTGKLGMLWTSWIGDIYTQGVAYSKSGRLVGPWVQETEPVSPPNFGHGMLFKTFEGEDLMVIHSHKSVNGKFHRVPKLFHVDLSNDKLVVTGRRPVK